MTKIDKQVIEAYELLMKAHNLLAKSSLNTDDYGYNPAYPYSVQKDLTLKRII